jgi:hypothetical protein
MTHKPTLTRSRSAARRRLALTALGLSLLLGIAGAVFWWAFGETRAAYEKTGRTVPAYGPTR